MSGVASKIVDLVKSMSNAGGQELNFPGRLELRHTEGGVAVDWGCEGENWELALYTESENGFKYFRPVRSGHVLSLPEGSYRVRLRANRGKGQVGPWCPDVFFMLAPNHLSREVELRISRKRGVVPRPQEFYDNVALIRSEIERRKTKLESFPVALSLILEGRGCNFKCFYCSHIIEDAHMLLGPENTFTKEYVFQPGEVLRVNRVEGKTVGAPPHLIEQIRANLPKLCTVMFGGSEPLLYPEFEELVKVTKDYPHVQCSVCTNGSLLHEELAEYIVRSNFPWIRVSIDGATPKTFKKIRKGKFEKVISNIKKLIELRGDKAWPKVQFNFVVCCSNYHEIPMLIDLAAEVGVNMVNYKMLIAHPGELGKAFVQEDPLSDRGLCVEIIDLMKEAVERAQQRGVHMTKEAVTPAIFARHPDLARVAVQEEVRRAEAAAVAERARRRAEEPDDDKGPITLAEYAKTVDEYHVVAAGGRYHRKTPEEISAMTEAWLRNERKVTLGAGKMDAMMAQLLEDEDTSDDAGGEACAVPARAERNIEWKKVFCHLPFTNISVGHNRAKFCCYAQQPYTVFYAGDDLNLQDIWNNPTFVEARQAMFSGNAAKVCKPTCPHLRHGGLKNSYVEELLDGVGQGRPAGENRGA